MLTGINFKNYKAFEEGKLEIKPITILLGANSVGKSSLIQLFLMLQETALAENYKSALKLHGGFFSLGEGINLFRKKDINNPLNIEIEFNEPTIKDLIQKDFFGRYMEDVINYCFFIVARISKNEGHLNFIRRNFTRPKSNKRQNNEIGFLSPDLVNIFDINREDLVQLIDLTYETLIKFQDKSLIKEVTHSRYIFHSNLIGQTLMSNRQELIVTYDFLKKMLDVKDTTNVRLSYSFEYIQDVLKIKKFKLQLGISEIVNVDFDKTDNKSFIKSEVKDFTGATSKQITELRRIFKNNKTVFSFIEYNETSESPLSVSDSYFVNFLSEIIDKVEDSFNGQRINYVSPLRAHPKRYYFLDKAKINTFLDTLDGEAIAEIIKENNNLKNSVNTWFKKFNLHIDVGPIKDIIHQIVVQQNSLDLDITDVGFGVSQVLPVIIQGFLSKDQSITLVEQPEIHLHPKMQADLADLFIDIAIRKNTRKNTFSSHKYLIIETHSEYLLKRLRRRISEEKINPDQVAIYYIEPQEETKSASIRKIDISSKGAFEWPKDFYTGELADDITEFLKNQI
ncbi:AAA family ATPase [Flavobacterium sp. SH_e]|uniref:AAA family ATPase n=1 Tax=Flavobacterium sp. SH_e TaxID=2983767 RepID=UPI0021E3E23C|nr:AAA family ATPase [Flavobacterium sp. SH_e]MCV2487625.1 AAA family ATPase [Flavobacterium sp. SH_e]